MRTTMRTAALAGAAVAVAASVITAPSAAASAASFCNQIAGQWNGQYCTASVPSDRKAVREISIATSKRRLKHFQVRTKSWLNRNNSVVDA